MTQVNPLTVADARTHVANVTLPDPPPKVLSDNPPTPDFVFNAAKEQAVVAGSDVISFVKGLTPEQRSDLVNASLLAQLAAKKKFPAPQDFEGVKAWYQKYFDVLSNIGFVIQDQGFAEYKETADTFEAHEAILDVAAAILGPASSALKIVTTTLQSLKKMDTDSPFLTLFHRESRSARTARFQVTLADEDETAQLRIRLMAFGIEAKAAVTQVLFFRFKQNESSLHHHSGTVTINSTILGGVRDDIAKKLGVFTKTAVAGLEI
jgi:hypothetical protein